MGVTLRNLIEDAVDGSFTLTYPDGSTAAKPFRQRSFDYGDDKPLITTVLPDINDEPGKIAIPFGPGLQINTNLDFIDGVTDNFIRGGATLAGIRAATDTARISKFLLTPKGIAHTVTQVALAKSNPVNLANSSRQYSPLNLLAQIPANIVPRVNIRKDGRIPIDTIKTEYEKVLTELIKDNAGYAYDEDKENPKTLISLYDKFIDTGFNASQTGKPIVFENPVTILKSYEGGPGSIFGIGRTKINRVVNTNQLFESEKARGGGDDASIDRPNFVEADLPTRQTIRQVNERVRSKYNLGDPGVVSATVDPNSINSDAYFMGEESGYRLRNKSLGIDKLNASPIIPRYNLNEQALEEYKDLIKFRFALIDTQDPLLDEVILFRAFLDDYNDNLQGKWTPYQYNGRAEDFHVYSGFGREINFNFKLGAQSEEELLPLYFKLNALMGSTAPEYVNRRMRGRYIRITIGDILADTPGFFNNINITWNPSYVWEIKTDKQLPHVISVNCNFTPIHDFAPQSKKDSPFILTRAALRRFRTDEINELIGE
jgi:hypothetical protein